MFVCPKAAFSTSTGSADCRLNETAAPNRTLFYVYILFGRNYVENSSHLQCNCRPCDLSPQIRIQFLNENDRSVPGGRRSFIFDAIDDRIPHIYLEKAAKNMFIITFRILN